MFVNFRIKNSRSFYDEASISLQATKDKELDEINTFYCDNKLFNKGDNKYLKSACIFGGNASGKTNIIRSLAYMINVINYSASQFQVVESNEHFAFLDGAESEDSLYEIEFVSDKIYYKYGFIINNHKIISEWLDKRKIRMTSVFKREGNSIVIKGLEKNITSFIKVPDNTLFLSIANNFNIDQQDILNVRTWLGKLIIVFESSVNALDIYSLENNKYKNKALQILKLADIGIDDFNVVKDKMADFRTQKDIEQLNVQFQLEPKQFIGQVKQENKSLYKIDVETEFKIYNKNNQEVSEKKVMLLRDLHFNSEGTNRLLCYLGWILIAIEEGRTIIIDEIDSKLHFVVADYIIKLFNSIANNPKNAQLICTAHNVMLMDEDLRRDQIYFTSKNKYGRSNLVSLSDYRDVRKNDLFSKKYLAGFYASLPNMKK